MKYAKVQFCGMYINVYCPVTHKDLFSLDVPAEMYDDTLSDKAQNDAWAKFMSNAKYFASKTGHKIETVKNSEGIEGFYFR